MEAYVIYLHTGFSFFESLGNMNRRLGPDGSLDNYLGGRSTFILCDSISYCICSVIIVLIK